MNIRRKLERLKNSLKYNQEVGKLIACYGVFILEFIAVVAIKFI